MVLLEEVHRVHEVAAVLREEVGEHRVRLREHVLERVVVDLHELAALHQAVHHRRDVRVLPHVHQAEHEVVGGQRMPVGPLDAGPQAHRGGAPVLGELPGLGEVRQHVAHVRREGEGVLPVEELPGVPERDAGGAAVLADVSVGLDDDGIVGQPLLDGRQAAAVEVGALGEPRQAGFASLRRRLEPLLRPGGFAIHGCRSVRRIGVSGGGGERTGERYCFDEPSG